MNLLSSTDGQGLVIAFDEVHVVTCPLIGTELRIKSEEQRFSCSIEVVADFQ